MTTRKQLTANRKNARKGGVKTTEGKELVKFNALKHGVLLQAVTEYEQPIYEDIQERLFKEYQPKTLLTNGASFIIKGSKKIFLQ